VVYHYGSVHGACSSRGRNDANIRTGVAAAALDANQAGFCYWFAGVPLHLPKQNEANGKRHLYLDLYTAPYLERSGYHIFIRHCFPGRFKELHQLGVRGCGDNPFFNDHYVSR